MADNVSYQVPAIAIRIPSGTGFISFALCSHTTVLVHDGFTFAPAVEIDYSKIGSVSMDLSTKSSKILNIPAVSGSLFGNIYDRLPYGHIEAFIYELDVDIDTDVVNSGRLIVKGLVYNASSHLSSRVLDLEIREDKYYFDKVGGVVCTEQCAVAFFGDRICKKAVVTATGVVDSVVKTVLTLTGVPTGATFIYNNGYIEFEGLRIKIAHWESGASFSMSEIPPDSWVGETVTITIGCDRTLASCRDIHNNESEFFGLGYSMVDYNALFEET